MKTNKTFAVAAVVLLVSAGRMGAGLTATVTPGYSFTEGETVTTSALNQLGQPSILISGTISGTVGLTAGSVTGVHLADSVVDGNTMGYTNSSPRAITAIRYMSGLWGIHSNINLTLAHSLNGTPSVVKAVLQCTSTEFGYAAGDEVDITCFYSNPTGGPGGTIGVPVSAFGANATSVFFRGNPATGAGDTWSVLKMSDGTRAAISTNKWMLRIYARL